MAWTGTPVTAPTDLTSTANVKVYLGISGSDDDTLIGQLIGRATDAIQAFCHRTFGSTTYTEYHDGRGESKIVLEHRPIISVASVYDDLDRQFGPETLIDSDDYVIREDEGIIEWLASNSTFPSTAAYFYDGQLNVKVTYTAGYRLYGHTRRRGAGVHHACGGHVPSREAGRGWDRPGSAGRGVYGDVCEGIADYAGQPGSRIIVAVP